jgi:P-type Mg2+ transporter
MIRNPSDKDLRPHNFWSLDPTKLLLILGSSKDGLTNQQCQRRIVQYGLNRLKPSKRSTAIILLLRQFSSPLVLILLAAAILSFVLHEHTDGLIIIGIVLLSGLMGFWREKGAADAVKRLLSLVQTKTTCIRDGANIDVLTENVVPGDIVFLHAGDLIPADSFILESKDFFVDEAALTGESYPAEKKTGVLLEDTRLSNRTNSVFMGTHVVSGEAKVLVVFTGTQTEFGKISEDLKRKPEDTEFEHGVRRFGYLLTRITMILVLIIFAISVLMHRPILGSFLFALALAVGLIPELLPAIIAVNLAKGAERMASEKVIVKRLACIDNFGSMDVLCCDKTGTITKGIVEFHSAVDAMGNSTEKALLYAYVNAFYETGFTNPIDLALKQMKGLDASKYKKLDEVPYDFIRRRLSVLVRSNETVLMITKGAVTEILAVCTHAEVSTERVELSQLRETLMNRFESFCSQGFRVLGIAYRELNITSITKDSESNMTFLGFLVFYDPPKPGTQESIRDLKNLGVNLKILTGDNSLVARAVSQIAGFSDPMIVTGSDLHEMSNEALANRANDIDIFAEVEPAQKERIINALRKSGNVVGYMGDGINDASALHVADVGISVDTAVDAAKEAADIVLLEKDLNVLIDGVRLGRMTFVNTMKYIFVTTSANFGNMFSMAGASLFLPFLPLLPKQILLNNFLTDFPAMTIATDNVDEEMLKKPQRWNIHFVRNFMILFGLVSSVFDFLTFGLLMFVLKASPDQFRTGWFLQSVFTELLILPVIRTKRSFFKSLPSKALSYSTILVFAFTLTLPYIMPERILNLIPLPISWLSLLLGVSVIYVIVSEITKKFFYRRST